MPSTVSSEHWLSPLILTKPCENTLLGFGASGALIHLPGLGEYLDFSTLPRPGGERWKQPELLPLNTPAPGARQPASLCLPAAGAEAGLGAGAFNMLAGRAGSRRCLAPRGGLSEV